MGISDGFVGGEDRGRKRWKAMVMASGGLDENGGQDRWSMVSGIMKGE